ncbi:MAG: SRPBCC domain-containing protein [Terriglobia bacterium]
MENTKITYVIHIATTPEKLWDALTSPEALKKNWGKIESPWTVGSKVTEVGQSGRLLWEGEVVHSEPPRLVSFTFDVTGSGEPPTEVTFELSPPASEVAPNTPVVRLTVTQVGFEENSKIFPGCVRAWPEILSSVKTYLETGRPLGFVCKHRPDTTPGTAPTESWLGIPGREITLP